MPVEVKMKNPLKLLEKLDISKEKISSLVEANVALEANQNGVSFSKDGLTLGKQPFSKGTISLVLNDELGPASKQALSYKLAKTINNVLDKANEMKSEDYPLIVPKAQLGTKLVTNFEGQEFKLDETTGCSLVKLIDATQMYQPVSGTSGSSVYHVVAIAEKHLKIAARYKNKTLSVRVEGHAVETSKNSLQQAGFSLENLSKGYVSVHMEVGDTTMANRALGALLVGIGMPFKTSIPNVATIVGKGF